MMPGVLSQSSGQKVVGLSAVSLTSNKQSDGAKKPQAMAASQQSGQSQLSQNNNEADEEGSSNGGKIPAADKQKSKAGGEGAAGIGATVKSGATKKQSSQQAPGE